MIWRDEDRRDELQKKLEYAQELEQQIELRKALELQEKHQQEEQDRQFMVANDETSPAKWWAEPGGASAEANHRFGFRMDSSALPYASPTMEYGDQGAASTGSASASHPRFRVADDPHTTQDRLREKAQQLEWRRLLDEQVREKECRQQQEAEEKRAREQDEAQAEVRFLRERQLRAQRKLGLPLTAAYSPQHYVSIPSPPAPPRADAPPQRSPQYGAFQRFGTRQADQDETSGTYSSVMPPPAPMQPRRLQQPQHAMNDSVDYNFRQTMGLEDPPRPSTPGVTQRDHIADEYRALLVEIRRERDELRREREELRREKEELRMERVLMQLENEKMATLLESQRQMNEQRQETMARLDRALEARAATVTTPAATPDRGRFNQRTPRPTRLPSPLHVNRHQRRDSHTTATNHTPRSAASPVAFAGRAALKSPPIRQRGATSTRPGAMSLADFAPHAMESPSMRRLAQLRRSSDYENPLEQSLNGESEFVLLSPRNVTRASSRMDMETMHFAAPRITETTSPTASRMDRTAGRESNALRNSRVIKSRGFYDFQRDDAIARSVQRDTVARTLVDHYSPLQTKLSPSRRARPVVQPETTTRASPEEGYDPRRYYHRQASETSEDEEQEQDEEDEEEEDDDDDDEDQGANENAKDQDVEPELSQSRFLVQVLVHE